ncbi:MAG TPA: hypothetical protein VK671_09345 [Mucilaginibacter sp.]|nr:hypothetical protein [Mucilaginibacter sp.]
MANKKTHPDYATLVDPLCCAKRVKKNKNPLCSLPERGWSSEAMTG